jgi:NAD(P)H-flavin reductase
MRTFEGRVVEMQMLAGGQVGAWISCPQKWAPVPGQYLAAVSPAAAEIPLASPLFPSAYSPQGFLAAAPLPLSWMPGSPLVLTGPLGRGFHLPNNSARIALAALGDSLARLLPLAEQALHQNAAVAIFADCPLPVLPPSLEAYPLSNLPEALSWPAYLALDLPLELLPGLRQRLGLPEGSRLPCTAEALISTPMPCRGMAECGACAVPASRGWKLACKDGPVFVCSEIVW